MGKPPHPLAARILCAVAFSPVCVDADGHCRADATANTPKLFYDLRCVLPMTRQVVACVGSDESSISRPAREARETIRTQPPFVDDASVQALF